MLAPLRAPSAPSRPQTKRPEQPPPEIVNSSSEAPVFRGDGIQLFGLDAELELKVRFAIA